MDIDKYIDQYKYETCQGCGFSSVVDVTDVCKIIVPVMDEFIDLVTRMREAQVSYFKARRTNNTSDSTHWLTHSKMLERQVNVFVEKYKNDKVQPKLF